MFQTFTLIFFLRTINFRRKGNETLELIFFLQFLKKMDPISKKVLRNLKLDF